MYTSEEVINLIREPKIGKSAELAYNSAFIKNEYQLHSLNDEHLKFRLTFTQHRINTLKLSSHHRTYGHIPLIRLDYKGPSHNNPVNYDTKTPDFLKPYANLHIPARKAHIHIYVEGCGLDWAVPVDIYHQLDLPDKFNIKIPDIENAAQKKEVVLNFIEIINVQSHIVFQDALN